MVYMDPCVVFNYFWITLWSVNATNITNIIYIVERITGYDTGVISGALVTIGSDLGPAELSNGQKVSILLMGLLWPIIWQVVVITIRFIIFK